MAIRNIFIICFFVFFVNLQSQEIYPDSVVYFDPQGELNINGLETINNFKYLKERDIVILNALDLDQSQKITDLKVIYYPGLEYIGFTDGSIMVKYDSSFDFNNYAMQNQLQVVKVFSDLNFVVLKTTNISELKSIIRELKGQIGVLSAKIDFIDPNYIPN
ncbi:hypothetical protein N9V24_05070 [Pseudomonadota bacterium]|nr:hypothetical protein [Pseudomonadota bacterium]